MSDPVRIAKIDADKRQVFGWANVSVRKSGTTVSDHQGHQIETDELAEAAYEFCLSSRLSGAEHRSGYLTGRMIESVVFTKEKMSAMGIPEGSVPEGWWLGIQVDDNTAWEKVKNGDYKMFSIEGTAVPEDV